MTAPRSYLLLASVCAVLALGCVALFEFLGASVDAQGLLHEPFVLIPLAWLFFAAAVYFAVRYWRVRRRQQNAVRPRSG